MCCVCRHRRARPQLHHINGDSSDNREENLAPVCGICHDEAHAKRALSQNLTPDRVRDFKQHWENDVAEKDKRAMSADYREVMEMRLWTYFNFGLLLKLHGERSTKGRASASLKHLQRQGILNRDGFPLAGPIKGEEARTVFDSWPHATGHSLRNVFSDLTEELISDVPPLNLDAVWSIRAMETHALTGTIGFFNRRSAFKAIADAGYHEHRLVRSRARNIEVVFQIDTWNVFSNSSLTLHFCGHSRIASLVYIRDVKRVMNTRYVKLVVNATPIAIGTGFPPSEDRTPAIAWKRFEENLSEDEDE